MTSRPFSYRSEKAAPTDPRIAAFSERYEKGREVIREMLPPSSVAAMEGPPPEGRFAPEFARLAFENAYVQLWTRPGLGARERSLLTLGILIALGNQRELRSHFQIATRNGLTRQELEEVIYHATAYAGFPMASTASAVAAEVLDEKHG
jgi:4-carboxymuconolactone decarboxylase